MTVESSDDREIVLIVTNITHQARGRKERFLYTLLPPSSEIGNPKRNKRKQMPEADKHAESRKKHAKKKEEKGSSVLPRLKDPVDVLYAMPCDS